MPSSFPRAAFSISTYMRGALYAAGAVAASSLAGCSSAAGFDPGTLDAGATPPGETPDSGGPSPARDAGGTGTPPDAGSGAGDDAGAAADVQTPPPGDAQPQPEGGGGALDPSAPPGGNFDLSLWELQEPVGSPGAPTTIGPSQLSGPNGFHDQYFYTDTDGSMTFWDPENGVHTANSNYARSELREMTATGAAANWLPPGTHTLSATVSASMIPDHVAVGQIHLGTGTPASTKPLLELFYYATGDIEMAIEQSPAGGNELPYPAGNVALGTKWSYVIGLSGSAISLVINGGAPQTWTMSSTFDQEGMYFKAGDYDQSSGSSATVGAIVHFYALQIFHGP